ncbi:MAG: coenzyme F420-0:L-glutamate ligase [Chloroflexi bacterium]|nr:coenzyme F420-0:L-glutamate ligase [Chloroflexota bacterium]
MRAIPSFSAFAIPDIPLIQPGDDIASIISDRALAAGLPLAEGDVLVVSSKIVSKAEGRQMALAAVSVSSAAAELAAETDKDPRLVELVLQEATLVSRARRGVLVTQHRLGFVSANSGLDQSNIESGDDSALLLPLDPDASASDLRDALREALAVEVGVVISDSHGRPFRVGNVGVAIGVAGIAAVRDLRGRTDLYGRKLEVTQQAHADLLASAAHLLCGEADEGYPAIVIRGLDVAAAPGSASDLNRAPEHDLYR